MSERIKTPEFNITTARDPVHLRQQIHAQQETIVSLWRSIGIDEASIKRNRDNQEWEIRRCVFQLRYPERKLLPHQSKKDRRNFARKRLETILSTMNEAAELNRRSGLRQTSSESTHPSKNGNLLWGQEQSFDHNGGVIFAPNSDDQH
jgi:hypothetical protein